MQASSTRFLPSYSLKKEGKVRGLSETDVPFDLHLPMPPSTSFVGFQKPTPPSTCSLYLPLRLLPISTNRCGHCKRVAPEYESLGISFKKLESVLIGKVNCDEDRVLCTKYKVSGFPTIKWFPKGSLDPIDYDGARTAEAFAEYVNNQAGTNVKVGAIPTHVVELNSDNFDEIVMDKTKHVLVEFYTTWCRHCKNLAPIYEVLATAFKNEDDIVIANVDTEKYKDLGERYGVRGFPTIKFFPKDNKSGEEYEGGLEIDTLVALVNKKCGTKRDPDGKLTSTGKHVLNLQQMKAGAKGQCRLWS